MAGGLTARAALKKFEPMQLMDVHLPMEGGERRVGADAAGATGQGPPEGAGGGGVGAAGAANAPDHAGRRAGDPAGPKPVVQTFQAKIRKPQQIRTFSPPVAKVGLLPHPNIVAGPAADERSAVRRES